MSKKITFYPLDIQYKEIDSKAVIFIYARSTTGEQILIQDDTLKPYFYAVLKEGTDADNFIERIKKVKVEAKKYNSFVTDAKVVNIERIEILNNV